MLKRLALSAMAMSALGFGGIVVASPANAGCTQVYYPGGAPAWTGLGQWGMKACYDAAGNPVPIPEKDLPKYVDQNFG